MKKLLFFFILLSMVLLAICCTQINQLDPESSSSIRNTSAYLQESFGSNVSMIFLYQNIGEIIWDAGGEQWFDNYNNTNDVNYTLNGCIYPTSDYSCDNYPYDYWNLWIHNEGIDNQHTLQYFSTNYDIIILKHGYLVALIQDDEETPNVASSVKTVANYQLQFNALKERLHAFPDNRFIIWTGAAVLETNTTLIQAQRAQTFFNWVKNSWDETGDNIYIWDFYQLETEGTLYLRPEYAYSESSNFPNTTFASNVAPLFCRRVADVITGYGDMRSITGE